MFFGTSTATYKSLAFLKPCGNIETDCSIRQDSGDRETGRSQRLDIAMIELAPKYKLTPHT